MSWNGIGLISANFSPLRNIDQIIPRLPSISPSADWTGTAASGFATPPTDPARTTAKPALRLLTPPFQWFTDTLDVGVIAAANDGGSLFNNLGIANVTFHYEGNSTVVSAPSWHTIQTQVGPRTYFGWWVRLKKPVDKAGEAHLYIEATARDAAMQRRVIGPYLFSPQDSLHDLNLEVAATPAVIPGRRYQTVTEAAVYASSQSAKNPLVTIIEAGLYDLTDSGGSTAPVDNSGYLNVTASVPGVVFGRASYTHDDVARLAVPRSKVRFFGPNITIDFKNILSITAASSGNGQFNWFDGITLTNSATRDQLVRGGPPIDLGKKITGFAYTTECTISELHNATVGMALVRGCDVFNAHQDIASDSWCIVQSSFRHHSDQFWNDAIPAFTVHYTGPEATANIARRGGTEGSNNGDGTGLYRVTIGATTYDFVVEQGTNAQYLDYLDDKSDVDGYWFQDVVDWLNTLPDVTATRLITPDRRAVTGCAPGLGKGDGFGFPSNVSTTSPLDIKTIPITIDSITEKHGDWYQHRAGELENIIACFNTVYDAEVQAIFLCPVKQSGVAGHRDMVFFGNSFAIADTPYYAPLAPQVSSQWGRGDVKARHIVIAHNTWANQGFAIRSENIGFEDDPYCLFKNNVMRRFTFGNPVFTDTVIDGLHLFSGSVPPAGATNIIIGGDGDSLLVDWRNGDFTPQGALLTEGFAPAIPFDRTGTAFPPIATIGALAVEATAYVASPPSVDPEGDLLALLNGVPGGDSSYHDFADANLVDGLWISADKSANGNDFTQATANRQPSLSTVGAIFDGNDMVFQTISGGAYSVIFTFTKDDNSAVGNVLIDQAQSSLVSYQQGSAAAFAQVVRVNGEYVMTRGALFDALHQAGRVTISIEAANFTGDTQLGIARSSSGLAGTVGRVIVINESDMAERTSEARDVAQQVAAMP